MAERRVTTAKTLDALDCPDSPPTAQPQPPTQSGGPKCTRIAFFPYW